MRPEDEAFWGKTASLPDELTVEEYAVADATLESPMDFEFGRKIPGEVYQKREAWRGGFIERRLAGNNELLQPFGYNIKAKQDSEMDLYQLYRKGELILDNIDAFWPVSVSASGKDFAMVAEIWNDGDRLVRNDSLADYDMSSSEFIPPVFLEKDLLSLRWVPERTQVQVLRGEAQIYAFPATFLVSSPVKGLWSWQGHWLMEVDGFLIQDGVNLNAKLGYEEIFGWQILNGKPFYYFRKGPRVGISYDGKILPVYYDDVFHYHCCGPAGYNAAGNGDMVWFYALRDGKWYYVEIGVYT
jgi:hypothetical protein